MDEDGIITTNEPVYEIAGKLDDYVPFGPGKFADKNETYMDKNGDIATIPKGFEIVEDAEIIKDGLVIQDEQGNQFVWIPVKSIAISEEEANEIKAMAVKVGENYRGVLYNFTNSNPTTSTIIKSCTTGNNHAEPYYLGFSDNSSYNKDENGNKIVTEEKMINEYNKMIESVKKYNGFFIGRYELGIEDNGKPVSKKDEKDDKIITANAGDDKLKSWYGLYEKCKEFADTESKKSVISSMLWGSQYDAMMNWMIEEGCAVGVDDTDKANLTGRTGGNEEDLIKNIFDLYGCHNEWTMESSYNYGSNLRYARGDNGNNKKSPSSRSSYSPNSDCDCSTRITLYICE